MIIMYDMSVLSSYLCICRPSYWCHHACMHSNNDCTMEELGSGSAPIFTYSDLTSSLKEIGDKYFGEVQIS